MTLDELYKILLSDNPSDSIKSNEERIFEIIPELRTCKGFNQNNEWHIYDVYEHIMHVVDGVPANKVMRLAALFHDIGKPASYKEDENGIGHFKGHWDESIKAFIAFADKFELDEIIRNRVIDLIYYHDMHIDKLDGNELKDVINKFGIEGIKELYELKRSDLLAQNPKYYFILDDYDKQEKEVLSSLIERVKEEYNSIKTPEEILEFMNKNISYGWIDNEGGRHLNELVGFRKKYRISSLNETLEIGLGTCIEQVYLMHILLDKIGINNKMFCTRVYEGRDFNNLEAEEHLHCFVLYYLNGKVYQIEHPDMERAGIHEFSSEEEAVSKLNAHYEEMADGITRPVTVFTNVEPGLSFKEFNEYINSLDNNRVMN